jgi:hypothetical protein
MKLGACSAERLRLVTVGVVCEGWADGGDGGPDSPLHRLNYAILKFSSRYI